MAGIDPVSAGIAGVSALGGIAMGLFQRAKARQLEKQTVRPVYQTPAQIYLNQQLAQKQASQGMDGTTYNTDLNNINRNASAGLQALSQQRMGVAGIGNIVAQSNDAALNLDNQDDAIKRQNLNQYMQQNQNVADYADKEFQYNKADKYAETMNKISQMRASGNANISSALNGMSSMAMSMANTAKVGTTGKGS